MVLLNLWIGTKDIMPDKINYYTFSKLSARRDKFGNDNNHFFASRFSNSVAYLLFLANLTPNMVTFLFLIVGLCASLSLFFGWVIVAYVCWRLHIILDMADGDIARATQVFSPFAKGFDRSNHIIINTLLIYAIAFDSQTYITSLVFYLVFQLYYNFDRNFEVKIVGDKIEMGIAKVFIKNITTFEGYIFASLLISFLELSVMQLTVNSLYITSMSLLFLYKLRLGFK